MTAKKSPKKFIRTSMNFVFADDSGDYETPVGVSRTVPDMSMSLRELLEKHTRGFPVPQFQGVYSDEELPDLDRLDLTEIQEIREGVALGIEDLKLDIEKQKKKFFELTKKLSEKDKTIPDPNQPLS